MSNPPSRWPQALDQSKSQIDLFESSKERKAYENLADLYTIITATEHLERAYAQDAITQSEYTSECNKLISQFKIAEKAALGTNNMTTETFMNLYQVCLYFNNAGVIHTSRRTLQMLMKTRADFIFNFCESFLSSQMDCPRAADRLLRMGVPEPLKASHDSGNVAVTVAETGKMHDYH